MINLDTHILIHALTDELRSKEREQLVSHQWGVSSIVLWEMTKLFQLGRITLDPGSADFARVLSRVHVWEIDLAICRALTALDFTSDPADELIAATSLVHRVPLLTRDRIIRKSKLIQFV